MAGALSLLALATFLFVTNKADRDARYAPNKDDQTVTEPQAEV